MEGPASYRTSRIAARVGALITGAIVVGISLMLRRIRTRHVVLVISIMPLIVAGLATASSTHAAIEPQRCFFAALVPAGMLPSLVLLVVHFISICT